MEGDMLIISATQEWKRVHAGSTVGLLELSSVENRRPSSKLDTQKREIEEYLRQSYHGFSRKDFLDLPIMAAYARYYKRFKKTYHILLQIESIVLKDRKLPDVSPLVDSNYMAELVTLILTAGHDIDKLTGTVLIDSSHDGDSMTQMNGVTREIQAGDMIMRDGNVISCSIIYGQDNRSPISNETTRVLYVAYAPIGVLAEKVETQLKRIEENVRLFSPFAKIEQFQLLSA
jgi:DNA/RNA-binding domain of Phe-tRNA-synthetase-like protein